MFTLDTWLGFAGALIGVIGIIIGIILYFLSIQKRVPMYRLEPLRVRIVDKTQMTVAGLDVAHNGQALGAQNVTAATLYFWNDGRRPIRNSDVLQPYAVQLDESASVLDCRVIASTREVCGFPRGQVEPSEDGHRLALPFDIIERSDGVALQIIYAGNPDATIRITGVAEGANEPRLSKVATSAYDAYGFLVSAFAGGVLGLIFLVAAGILLRTVTITAKSDSTVINFSSIGLGPFIIGILVGGTGLVYLGKALFVFRKFTGFRSGAIARLAKKASGPP